MEKVPNIEHFKIFHQKIVHGIVECRKQSGITQSELADWLNIDRRKIIDLEACKKVPFSLILLCADKFSIDVNFNYQVN